jgi:hypothetical protein
VISCSSAKYEDDREEPKAKSGVLPSSPSLLWRWIFYINLPVGVLCTLGIVVFIRQTRTVHREPFDLVATRRPDRPLPDWEAVEKELRGRGATLRLLWLEYLSRHPEGYRYTQFCAHFHTWQRRSRPPTTRRQHRAGEALEVDLAA